MKIQILLIAVLALVVSYLLLLSQLKPVETVVQATIVSKSQVIGPQWQFNYNLDNGCIIYGGEHSIGEVLKVDKLTCKIEE